MFYGDGTKGRLEGCEIARNKGANLEICFGADPSVVGCKYVLTGEHDRAYHAICTLHLSDLFPLHLFKCRRSLSPPPPTLSLSITDTAPQDVRRAERRGVMSWRKC